MRAEAGPISDPRLRILAVLALAFAFSALHGALSLALMALLTFVLVRWSGTRARTLVRRLRAPAIVVVALVSALPFASGETVLATFGPLAVRVEGLSAAFGVALRFLCIFALIVAILGPTPAPRLLEALRGLGLPPLMVDMAMLTLRHVEDARADFARLQVAARLRGAPRGGVAWVRQGGFRATGWMLASLLMRSHARSERVYHAMILRGHGAPGAAAPDVPPASAADKIALAGIVGAAAALVAVERLA